MVDESDDEEIDEDEAFNSEDERKYGSFFSNGGGSDDEDDSASDDEDEGDEEDEEDGEEIDGQSEDDDGGQYMLDLLDSIDNKKKAPSEDNNSTGRLAGHVKESPFAASVVPAANLTLDSLMDGLKDTKGFGTVAKTLKKVATGKATPAPLAKVKADRVERKLHYEQQSKEVSQWVDAVQENRKAETLDFRPKERVEATLDVMIASFVPTSDFEKELQAALEAAGQQDEKAILEAEEKVITDDLGNHVITMEEYQKRRGQLAKMRALMLYHEQKRSHIHKIKSKKYRRIRKRQRERLQESDLADAVGENPDLALELEEKEEVDRMKERMTLAHKNTSKWAKRILKRGKHVDSDTRKALSAQLRKGDDLLKRMKSRTNGDEDDDSDEEDLVDSARKVLKETETDELPENGVFKLKFMQKGMERQRLRAKEEARQLLEELEETVPGDGDDEGEETERLIQKKINVASASEMKGVMKAGKMQASSLTFGKSTSLAVSGDVSLDLDGITSLKNSDSGGAASEAPESVIREHSAILCTDGPKGDASTKQTLADSKERQDHSKSAKSRPSLEKKKPAATGKEISTALPTPPQEENPWLAAAEASGSSKKKSSKSHRTGVVDVERAANILETSSRSIVAKPGTSTKSALVVASEAAMTPQGPGKKRIAQLTQDELVRRAFAGVNDQDDFDEEKKRIEDEENGVLAKSKKKGQDPSTVSGWGSWTGEGAPPPLLDKKRRLPKSLQAPKKKVKRERKDQGKPTVILREGRMTKMANSYMIQQVPHPYKSREEYERSMAGGIGGEWNMAVKEMTRPDVLTRTGKIIKPLSMQAKRKVNSNRPAAKF